MSVKIKAIILAFTIAVITGLLLLSSWHSKTKQITNNDANKNSAREHVHILQDKSADEEQKDPPRLNKEQKSPQPDDTKRQSSRTDECALIRASNAERLDGFVVFQIIVDDRSEEVRVSLDDTLIQLRTDGQNVTTIILSDKIGQNFIRQDYKSGIILVPNKEDVETWQNWLNKQKQKNKEFLAEQEARKKSRRVLPPTY